ncbi:TBC1 domain family member 21 isoform X2 [Nannospalax galili]|uniref:TBC1 domain family member 21 isoform X2 n=1 Tax=Nannospalax galili TaxID=1026970 RepID=UPI00111C7624|nr:TBC1 domain family member 21 isoform X2 [Nannospalax galili]
MCVASEDVCSVFQDHCDEGSCDTELPGSVQVWEVRRGPVPLGNAIHLLKGRSPSPVLYSSLGLLRRTRHRLLQRQLARNMTTLSPENSLSAKQSASFILAKRNPPIDKTEWDSFFDENGHLAKSRDFICVNILERGLHPFVRTEAWKLLTGYYSWQSSRDDRLMVDSKRRRNYEALCKMYEKIQPLLENLHQNFTETQNNIAYDIQKLYDKDPLGNVLIDKKKLEKILLLSYVCNTQAEYQQGFHEMVMLFQIMVEHDYETFWLFQFFLQKTEHSCVINIGVGKNLDMLSSLITFLDPDFAEHLRKGSGAVQFLFPWFCLCFQRAFKSFDDVWRLWEVLLTGKPCRNFQVLVAYSMLQMVREQALVESMSGDAILLACNNLIDLDADELISTACLVYAELMQKEVPQPLKDFFL